MATHAWTGRELGDKLVYRMKNLLGVFVAAILYFVLGYYLTNLYITEHHGVVHFFLVSGGVYPMVFWVLQVFLGAIVPMALLWHPTLGKSRTWISVASGLVILGGLAQMYVLIIGGQAYPLEMFPGKEVISSSFYDGVVASYSPTLPEVTLGLGGTAVALLGVVLAMKVLRFIPESLADEVVDPHHTKAKA
jgi:molybdopterin-containing oxidoreductase family membrane subunit